MSTIAIIGPGAVGGVIAGGLTPENLADAVVIVDDAGIIRETNPAAWRIFGFGPAGS